MSQGFFSRFQVFAQSSQLSLSFQFGALLSELSCYYSDGISEPSAENQVSSWSHAPTAAKTSRRNRFSVPIVIEH
jgi:hypothetical protein